MPLGASGEGLLDIRDEVVAPTGSDGYGSHLAAIFAASTQRGIAKASPTKKQALYEARLYALGC
jgi:hypothetical protein